MLLADLLQQRRAPRARPRRSLAARKWSSSGTQNGSARIAGQPSRARRRPAAASAARRAPRLRPAARRTPRAARRRGRARARTSRPRGRSSARAPRAARGRPRSSAAPQRRARRAQPAVELRLDRAARSRASAAGSRRPARCARPFADRPRQAFGVAEQQEAAALLAGTVDVDVAAPARGALEPRRHARVDVGVLEMGEQLLERPRRRAREPRGRREPPGPSRGSSPACAASTRASGAMRRARSGSSARRGDRGGTRRRGARRLRPAARSPSCGRPACGAGCSHSRRARSAAALSRTRRGADRDRSDCDDRQRDARRAAPGRAPIRSAARAPRGARAARRRPRAPCRSRSSATSRSSGRTRSMQQLLAATAGAAAPDRPRQLLARPRAARAGRRAGAPAPRPARRSSGTHHARSTGSQRRPGIARRSRRRSLVVGEAQHRLVVAKRSCQEGHGHGLSTIGPAGDAAGPALRRRARLCRGSC